MDNSLKVQVSKTADVAVIGLTGDLDMYTCPKLGEIIECLIDDGDLEVVVNMADVGYVDSFGLGTLVGSFIRINEKQGHLAISSINPRLETVLRTTGLSKVFDVFDGNEEAVLCLSSHFAEAEPLPLAA